MSQNIICSGKQNYLPIESRRTSDVNLLPLQHPDHSIEIGRVQRQVSPAVGAVDEELELEHVLNHSDHTEVEPMSCVQIRFVVVR